MIEVKRMLITPSIAKEMLEANISNRRVNQPTLNRYVNDMKSERWKEDTVEPIKISKTGIIIDGQHRLLAIIKSNKSMFFFVATGLNDDVFDVLDTGKSRNATDIFKIKGIQRENVIPSIISMYNLLKEGKKMGAQKNKKSTNAMLLEQYMEDENFWQEVARKSHNWYLAFAKIITPSQIGGFYAYLVKLNPEKGEEFIKQLTTGIGIENDSVNLLRNKLMQDKMSIRKMPPTLKIALIIRSWNYFVKNQTVKVLKYDAVREEYPVAVAN